MFELSRFATTSKQKECVCTLTLLSVPLRSMELWPPVLSPLMACHSRDYIVGSGQKPRIASCVITLVERILTRLVVPFKMQTQQFYIKVLVVETVGHEPVVVARLMEVVVRVEPLFSGHSLGLSGNPCPAQHKRALGAFTTIPLRCVVR